MQPLRLKKIAYCLFLFHFTIVLVCTGQYAQYPKDYFMFPIKPGQQNYLAGSMGELRPNHFHGGIDIKTDQKTGLPVYAAADGYVSRIAVSSKGYGNALYIQHANGLTTVYGHLEWFNTSISQFIMTYLYSQQCNETDQMISVGLLPVKKGEIIAWSGNSGSSGGPHLHWEIRDQQENLLNPLFFKFNEIVDRQDPYINKIAIRSLNIDARIEGEFGRFEYIPARVGGGYELKYPVHAQGLIGIDLIAYDAMDGTGSKCGISKIEMKVDGKETFVHDIQKISFEGNPYVNAHMDYQTLKEKGNYFQHCYVADGNMLNTYKTDALQGKILINDTLMHSVHLKVYDSYRNFTTLSFQIKGIANQSVVQQAPKTKTSKITLHTSRQVISENSLQLFIKGNTTDQAIFYFRDVKINLKPAYQKNGEQVYLWDLRKSLPDSAVAGMIKHTFDFKEIIPSQSNVNFTHKNMDITFGKYSILDTMFLNIGYENGTYTIQDLKTPLINHLSVVLKPSESVENKTKTAVYNVASKRNFKYSGGEWIGNNIRFKTKYLGDFTLRSDTIPPRVKFKSRVGNTVYFYVSDNLSGIMHWYAYLDGNFLLMNYDPKYNVLFTNDINRQPIHGNLLIGVMDNMGNLSMHPFKL